MEKERHAPEDLPECMATYCVVVFPVFDDEGMVVAAEFPLETARVKDNGGVGSAPFGFGNVRQHLLDQYYAFLTPEHEAMWERRTKKACPEQPPSQEGLMAMWSRPDLAKPALLGRCPVLPGCNAWCARCSRTQNWRRAERHEVL